MTTRLMIFLLGFIMCLNADYSFSEDIVLKSGKTYKNIDVYKQEADRLLITHPGGMATIYLKDCPADIQQKYNYNTTNADTAISEREKKAQATQVQLQRDQKAQLEIWKKQQVAQQQAAQQNAAQQQAVQQKAAAEQLERERLIKAQSIEQQAIEEANQKTLKNPKELPPYVMRDGVKIWTSKEAYMQSDENRQSNLENRLATMESQIWLQGWKW